MNEDKTYLITGATDGIGLVTALELARTGGRVIATGRDPEKGEAIVSRIRAMTGNPQVTYLNGDLSLMTQVRQMAGEFLDRHNRLDVLINNAGAFFIRRKVSEEGFEQTFAVNHLGHFLLTNLLLDTIIASAPARIINVSSNSHFGSPLDFEDLQNQKRYSGRQAYGRAKFANVLFTYALDRRLEGTGVTANCLHPGWVATNIGRNNGWLARLLMPLIQFRALSPEQGAITSIYLATSTEVEGVSGNFYTNRKEVPSDPASYDEAAADRLWQMCKEAVSL